ncbi:MAG TPA: LPS-assembly protein LptD, partial [Nitrospirae bacterium]|nr:LPS-assembly protein LptD [Nitrospirota bacterium]
MRNRTSGLLKIKRDSLAAGKMYGRTVFTVFCSVLLCFLFISPAASAEDLLNISADNLEHDPDKNAYTASGSVRITYGETTLSADKILFYESTSDAVATGNVVYEDEEVIIKAEVVELNLETRLGTIYSCDIFYKKLNYHINGIDRLDKLGETTYHLDRA